MPARRRRNSCKRQFRRLGLTGTRWLLHLSSSCHVALTTRRVLTTCIDPDIVLMTINHYYIGCWDVVILISSILIGLYAVWLIEDEQTEAMPVYKMITPRRLHSVVKIPVKCVVSRTRRAIVAVMKSLSSTDCCQVLNWHSTMSYYVRSATHDRSMNSDRLSL